MNATRLSWFIPVVCLFLPAAVPFASLLRAAAPPALAPEQLEASRVFLEFDAASGDLALRVGLEGEDWRDIQIVSPDGKMLFGARGQGPLSRLGLANLSFAGVAAPLDQVPLDHVLKAFPEGRYEFVGTTGSGQRVVGHDNLNHVLPAAPVTDVQVSGTTVTISWQPVTSVAEGFPEAPVEITGYRVLAEKGFGASLPPTATSLVLPSQVVEFLGSGSHRFQVLAIEKGGNRAVSTGSFILP
jgi:hypothetical protein